MPKAKMPNAKMKRKFDPYDTTNLSRQVKTVVFASLTTSILLGIYTGVVGYMSSLEPDLSAMLLDGIIVTTCYLICLS